MRSSADIEASAQAGVARGSRFEQGKQRLGLVGAPLVALLVWWQSDFHTPALPALMALCVLWWVTEALPSAVVALAVALGAVIFDLASPTAAFGTFGKPQLFLFVGSFFIAEAMHIHGVGERLANAMTRRATTPFGLMAALGATAFVLSMVMSNAAATAILLPIGLSTAKHRGPGFASSVVLVVAWAASVGGLATPIGTPPNLFGIDALRRAGVEMSFVRWMTVGLPIGAIMLGGLLALMRWVGVRQSPIATATGAPPQADAVVAPGGRGRWRQGEKAVAIAIAVAIVGWLTPSIAAAIDSSSHVASWTKAHLTEEVVSLLAGCLLFVLPANHGEQRGPALTWQQAVRIDWGVILLFGGGMLLGDLAGSTGLASAWGQTLVSWTQANTTWTITALCTAIAIVLSEATSNTATATLMAPLASELARASGAAVAPCVLGATLGASFGFMMPISTAPNALAYATGKVTIGTMMRLGIVFDVIGFGLIVVGLRVLCPLLGLM